MRYVILPEAGKIKLDPPPDAAEKYAMPYQKEVANLSGNTDTPGITTISSYLEYAAISVGFSYKKEYDASVYWNNKAESELQKLITEENVKINQIYQRVLSGRTVRRRESLLGDKSYDTV